MVTRLTTLISFLTLLSAASVGLSQGLQCTHPATVAGRFATSAPNCIVIVRPGHSQSSMALHLATKYHFTPYVLSVVHGFIARNVTVEMVAKLRCEEGIESIEYDQTTSSN